MTAPNPPIVTLKKSWSACVCVELLSFEVVAATSLSVSVLSSFFRSEW